MSKLFDSYLKKNKVKLHRDVYFASLCMIAVFLPFSKFLLSISVFILFFNYLFEGNFREKLSKIRSNRHLLLFISIYFIHIIWLFNTSDFAFGLADLRIKLPLLILPIIIATSYKLSKIEFRNLILLFSLAILVSTIISLSVFLNLWGDVFVKNSRISIFISHIRFALFINLVIFSLFYFIFNAKKFFPKRTNLFILLLIIVVFWLICFIFILKSLTGILVLFLLFFVFSFYFAMKIKHLVLRLFVNVLLVSILLISISYVNNSIARYYKIDKVDYSKLETTTEYGNFYAHQNAREIENGHFVNIYICEKELREKWNKVSKMDYNGADKNGNQLKQTLKRYLTSLNLRKDAQGISQLTPKDINNIENSIANYIYADKFSFYPKIYDLIWQLDNYFNSHDPYNYSVPARIEAVKIGLSLIKENLLLGVGTGDTELEYTIKYKKKPYYQAGFTKLIRSHNQYLTFFVSFGLFAFIWIVFVLLYPLIWSKNCKNYFFIVFYFISFLSFFNEDTLETQVGLTFFVFFYSIFVFAFNKTILKDETSMTK